MKIENNKKETILEYYKFEKTEGFLMDYDKPEDDEFLNVFITKEEWFNKSLEGFKTFWWNGKAERLLDLDEAWEYLEEDIWDRLGFKEEKQAKDYYETLYAKIVIEKTKDNLGVLEVKDE